MSQPTASQSGDSQLIQHLGPLASLAGNWEGHQGIDRAVAKTGPHETHFRERLKCEPIGPVVNDSQVLYGLRYSTVAWPLIQEHPFHEEVGYWLWDADGNRVMRCFVIPQGSLINAGGTVATEAKEFHLTAELGSSVYGILSNPHLDQTAKAVRYDCTITFHESWKFGYTEDTQLQIPGHSDLFHHTHQNTLSRI